MQCVHVYLFGAISHNGAETESTSFVDQVKSFLEHSLYFLLHNFLYSQ